MGNRARSGANIFSETVKKEKKKGTAVRHEAAASLGSMKMVDTSTRSPANRYMDGLIFPGEPIGFRRWLVSPPSPIRPCGDQARWIGWPERRAINWASLFGRKNV